MGWTCLGCCHSLVRCTFSIHHRLDCDDDHHKTTMLPALLPPHLEDKLLEEGNWKKSTLEGKGKKRKKKDATGRSSLPLSLFLWPPCNWNWVSLYHDSDYFCNEAVLSLPLTCLLPRLAHSSVFSSPEIFFPLSYSSCLIFGLGKKRLGILRTYFSVYWPVDWLGMT